MSAFPTQPVARTADDLAARLGAHPLTLLETLDFDPLEDVVLASGSIVEGFGNEESDVDLFVVRRHARPAEQIRWRAAERWVDVSTVTQDRLRALSNALPEIAGGSTDWTGLPMPGLGDVDLAHRLSIAVPLTHPLSESHPPRFSVQRLARVVAYQNLVTARARWVDAIGAWRSGQSSQAWWTAFLTLGHSVDAYCALMGETNPSPKWRWARLARLDKQRREPLSLFRRASFEQLCDSCEQTLQLAASTLFAAQCIFARGIIPEPSHPSEPHQRFELQGSQVLLVIDGVRATPVDHPMVRP